MKYNAGLTNRIQSIDGCAGTDWNNDVNQQRTDHISLQVADTIGAAFKERVRRTPGKTAYIQFNEKLGVWQDINWRGLSNEVARWQAAFTREGLQPGDRVAMMLRNCVEWVMFDLAAQGLGLVTVPIYTNDRAENIGYILQDAGVRLLLLDTDDHWTELQQVHDQLSGLVRIVTLDEVDPKGLDDLVRNVDDWLPKKYGQYQAADISTNDLASIVYTSGTTGRSKGVMLSHCNMLWNIEAGLKLAPMYTSDLFLSFLPLSHTLERTVGYYMPIIAGAEVAYSRSIPQLGDDLVVIKPTVLVSVPRIFEKVYAKIQDKLHADPKLSRRIFHLAVNTGWQRFKYQQRRASWSPMLLLWPLFDKIVAGKIQQKLGGRLRLAISGGAALSENISQVFIGLGVNIIQGYGLTETSPIISANPLTDNIPASVGVPLPGIEVKVGENDELLTRSPSVMLGYWNHQEATNEAMDDDGWLYTGDKARIEHNHIFITGRIKEIIVLSNGEKISPSDMELHIALDPLFEQAMVIGEGKPFLSALVVLDHKTCKRYRIKPNDTQETQQVVLRQIAKRIAGFPGYAKVQKAVVIPEPWTVENGLITPTMKMRRRLINEKYDSKIKTIYEE
jgi:long-chain acyl-CoA synthetase